MSGDFEKDQIYEVKTGKKTRVEYRNVSAESIYGNYIDRSKEFSDIAALPLAESLIILKNYRFNSYKAESEYFEDNNIVEKLCLWTSDCQNYADEYLPGKLMRLCKNTTPVECSCCYAQLECGAGLSLCKHHTCCVECWVKKLLYMTMEISNFNTVIRCDFNNEPPCRAMTLAQALDIKELNNIVVPYYNNSNCKKLYSLHQILQVYYAIWARSVAIRCCTPNCQGMFDSGPAIKDSITVPVGKCDICNNKTCFLCADKDHSPASCKQMANWKDIEKNEEKNVEWLKVNTKNCPKCNVRIEKNHGCNHMTCSNLNCRYEFCWVCLGDWSAHGGDYYHCNNPHIPVDADIGNFKNSLNRYHHYWERYQNNKHSSAMEQTEVKTQKLRLEKRYKEDLTFLDAASTTLFESRIILQNCAVKCYYADYNSCQPFNCKLSRFTSAVEKLSELLEASIDKIDSFQSFRSQIVSQTNICQNWVRVIVNS